MMIKIKGRSELSLVLIGTNIGNIICNLIPKECSGFTRHYNYFRLEHFNEDLTSCNSVTGDIIAVYGMYGELLWKRQPERVFIIDGAEYPESTLRSLIKKATE